MRGTILAVIVAASLGACRDRDNNNTADLRTLDADELARQGKLTLGDSQVVVALRSPKQVGRIIYEAPTDLSLANAMRTRPDLFPSDTTRRATTGAMGATARTPAARDSTGGDATADTSGGAARPRRRP